MSELITTGFSMWCLHLPYSWITLSDGECAVSDTTSTRALTHYGAPLFYTRQMAFARRRRMPPAMPHDPTQPHELATEDAYFANPDIVYDEIYKVGAGSV